MYDKLEITEVVNRYFAALDQRLFDPGTFSQIFADDAVSVRPNGAGLTGPEAIRESHVKSMERFRATQHLTSGFIIEMAGDSKADFRVNLIALHFWKDGLGDSSLSKDDNYFLAGGVVSGSAIKTSKGWRIQKIAMNAIWRKGVGFQEMLNTK